jgi:hypothetical protein
MTPLMILGVCVFLVGISNLINVTVVSKDRGADPRRLRRFTIAAYTFIPLGLFFFFVGHWQNR